MAGRHHHNHHHLPPPTAMKLREIPPSRANPTIGGDPLLHHRLTRPSSTGLEDRVAIQHSEIQSLLVDNQRLAATHVALKQELAAAHQELRALSAAAAGAKAERDAQVREVYERSVKMEVEVRGIDAMAAELAQVRGDAQKLGAARKELAAQLQTVEDDLARDREDSKQVPVIKAEIESVRREIQKGRAAIEIEKKTQVHNFEHRQAMEKHMVSMVREIEKLRAELANAERRARAAAAAAANPNPGYAAISGNYDMVYGTQPYPDPYSMHLVLGVANSNTHYGFGTMPHGSSYMQQTNMYR